MYIKELHIENIKLIKEMRLLFSRAEETRMWTVLVGENGLCKTSILQAIALAALGEGYARMDFRKSSPLFPTGGGRARRSQSKESSSSVGFATTEELIPVSAPIEQLPPRSNLR